MIDNGSVTRRPRDYCRKRPLAPTSDDTKRSEHFGIDVDDSWFRRPVNDAGLPYIRIPAPPPTKTIRSRRPPNPGNRLPRRAPRSFAPSAASAEPFGAHPRSCRPFPPAYPSRDLVRIAGVGRRRASDQRRIDRRKRVDHFTASITADSVPGSFTINDLVARENDEGRRLTDFAQ